MEQPGESAIVIKNLRKIYTIGSSHVRALNRVDLTIPKGQICCLLGPSGSGKSTLLNMIAGLEKPTTGTIIVNGQHIETMGENRLVVFRQKEMGFIFQSYNLLPALTALENVALPLIFRGVSRRRRNKRAMDMLRMVGLERFARHKPTQMSGGQQQRVGIARAFASGADIILADEPTGNLDSKTTARVMDLIVQMVRRRGQTMIVVTHDQNIASYGDRIVRILDGAVESDTLVAQNPLQTSEAL